MVNVVPNRAWKTWQVGLKLLSDKIFQSKFRPKHFELVFRSQFQSTCVEENKKVCCFWNQSISVGRTKISVEWNRKHCECFWHLIFLAFRAVSPVSIHFHSYLLYVYLTKVFSAFLLSEIKLRRMSHAAISMIGKCSPIVQIKWYGSFFFARTACRTNNWLYMYWLYIYNIFRF